MRNFLFVVLISINSSAQIIISSDTTVCGSYEDTLFALSSVQSSMAVDDQHDVVVPIGFTFNFYGLPYTQLVVSGNGYITFDLTQASQYSPWVIGAPIPNPGNLPENAIMAPWQDINTGIGGAVYYGVTGIAPNRMFIVTWCAVPMFSCTSNLHTSQVVLYEGSDKIEMYLQDKPLCITWNGGAAIQGLVDANSTNFDIVDDPVLLLPRNWPLTWTATNEGWEFLPNSPATSYTINPIAYVPIIAGSNTWTDASGNILGTGPALPVNISTTTTYFANITGSCASGVLADSITITITGCFDIDLTSTPASCLGDDASIVCAPDTLLPLWDAELLDMNGNSLFFIPNIVDSSYIFANLFPGTYIVSITAGISSSQDTIIVGQVQNPMFVSSSFNGVDCYGGSNGQISVNAGGGLLPFTYYIDGVLNTNAYPLDSVFDGLNGGTYIISVIDDNDCMIRDTVVITSPNYTLQALASSKVIICNGDNNGEAVGSAAGGTPGYSYEWFDSGMNSFSTNDTAFGLSAGSYYLEVMDANGCDTFTTVNVIAPQVPLSASPELFNVSCTGDATGMIVGDAAGSWAPYTYYWLDMNGDTLQQSDPYISTRDTLFDLLAGNYQLHVVDAQGCEVEYVLNIAEPAVALSIDSMNIISTIACYGDSDGIARLYVSGGDPVYSYLWDNGETGIIASSLSSGYHSVSVIDDWGCEVFDSIYMSENPLIESALVADTTVSCYGVSDGVASISSSGGASSTYTYFWSTGQQTSGVNADTAVGLLHGSYYVITRDVLGCEVLDSIYISQPEPLTMEALELDWIDCYGYNNGEAFATATGGTAPYSFSWDNGIWAGDTVYTLTPGFHTVVVTDARGCTATDTIETHEPDLLYINILEGQAILPYCGQLNINTASLSSLAGGGTGSYIYEWNDNPVQPQTTATAVALTAFNYYNPLDSSYIVTVTDDKGCIASDTTTILQGYTETMELSIGSLTNTSFVGGNDISCYGEDDGQAFVLAFGGHGPYSYQWYGPNGYVSTNDTISDLLAGVYSVYINDTNGCSLDSSIVITEPSNIFFVDSAAIDESCLGACDGEIIVNVSGGISPYLAMATETSTGSVTTIAMGLGNDSIVGGLCSGTYTLMFTDENGCSSTLVNGGLNQQTISTSDTTVAEINTSNILTIVCNGDSTGELEVLNPNTSAGYTYSWQDLNGNVVGNGSTASSLLAGTYVLYAEYNNISGCVVTDTATVPQVSSINPSAVITHVDCYGNSTGVLQGSFQGGTPPYIMLWSTGDLGSSIDSLTAGMYTLTITDSNNCQQVDTFEVTQPDSLLVNVDSANYILTANLTGGTAPYSYSWREASDPSNEIGTAFNYIVSTYGIYYVIVTDANGCMVESERFYFPEPPPPPNSWDCIDDACVDPGDGSGFYSSLSSCEALCLPTDLINISSEDISLNIYPNPFREETTVDFGQIISRATIRIVDVYGKMIETHELTNTDKYIIKRTNKASGVYFIEIEVEGIEIFNKVILE